jgi:hypothetical protein
MENKESFGGGLGPRRGVMRPARPQVRRLLHKQKEVDQRRRPNIGKTLMKRNNDTTQSEPETRLSVLPQRARKRLIDEMTRDVARCFRSRAEEVLGEPGNYGNDMNDLRWRICGAFAEDLHDLNGEAIEEFIQESYEKAGLPTSVPKPPLTPPDDDPFSAGCPVQISADQ